MPSPSKTQRMIDLAVDSLEAALLLTSGPVYYVDAVNGNNSNSGKSWSAAWATLTKALTVVNALTNGGATIFFKSGGTTLDDGALTLSADQVRIIGADPSPFGNRWGGADGETVLTVTGDECELRNIRFSVPTEDSGGGIGLECNGSYGLRVLGCRFQASSGAYYGININGGSSPDNMLIDGCEFTYFNTATYGTAIRGHTYGGSNIVPSAMTIKDCRFTSNLNNIVCRMRQSFVVGNHMPEKGVDTDGSSALTVVKQIDLDGTNSKLNHVAGNFIGGDYSTSTCREGGDDTWIGNFSDDTGEAEVGDNGITVAPPAA